MNSASYEVNDTVAQAALDCLSGKVWAVACEVTDIARGSIMLCVLVTVWADLKEEPDWRKLTTALGKKDTVTLVSPGDVPHHTVALPGGWGKVVKYSPTASETIRSQITKAFGTPDFFGSDSAVRAGLARAGKVEVSGLVEEHTVPFPTVELAGNGTYAVIATDNLATYAQALGPHEAFVIWWMFTGLTGLPKPKRTALYNKIHKAVCKNEADLGCRWAKVKDRDTTYISFPTDVGTATTAKDHILALAMKHAREARSDTGVSSDAPLECRVFLTKLVASKTSLQKFIEKEEDDAALAATVSGLSLE